MSRLLALTAVFLCWLLPASAQELDGSFPDNLIAAAIEQTKRFTIYDGSYVVLDYPGGDVPEGRGVCTDVIIRAYREIGADLQVLVHEDMRDNFDVYPDNWGLTRPDKNIDHRRVPNLQTFFTRHGEALPLSTDGSDFEPGDIVTWMLGGRLPHIGIVTDKVSRDGKRPLIVHNIGYSVQLEDMLFDYPITGRYRFEPAS